MDRRIALTLYVTLLLFLGAFGKASALVVIDPARQGVWVRVIAPDSGAIAAAGDKIHIHVVTLTNITDTVYVAIVKDLTASVDEARFIIASGGGKDTTGTGKVVFAGKKAQSDAVEDTFDRYTFSFGIAAGDTLLPPGNILKVAVFYKQSSSPGTLQKINNQMTGFQILPGTSSLATTPVGDGVTFGIRGSGSTDTTVVDTGRAISIPGTITTVAGDGRNEFVGDGGLATRTGLKNPAGVFVDRGGSIYITDTFNYRIRKVDQLGVISTVVGSGGTTFSGDGGPAMWAGLVIPSSVFLDAVGNMYIAGINRIRRVDAVTGVIGTVAGNGTYSYSGDGGPATVAGIWGPSGVFLDKMGSLYFADSGNNRIRKVDGTTGIITTIAGRGTSGYSGDGGPAVAASLNSPRGVFVDSSLSVFIADTNNHRIRFINGITGIITTVAGSGIPEIHGDGGPATEAGFALPGSIFLDSENRLFIADTWHHQIRMVDRTGIIRTVVATNDTTAGYGGDGGPASEAKLRAPTGVFIDGSGNLFIADSQNNRVRVVKGIAAPTILETGSVSPAVSDTIPGKIVTVAEPDSVNSLGTAVLPLEQVSRCPMDCSWIKTRAST